jgi:microcompartment protein CcmL/EutN
MYDNGELASEYDTKRNKMINSLELIAIMEDVEELIPEALSPIEAAREMRQLEEKERQKAIEESKQKVIDMRKHFQNKMSLNGGALGLTEMLIRGLESNDLDTVNEATGMMIELVKHKNEEMPEKV